MHLKCTTISSVPSSYANLCWRDAVVLSTQLYGMSIVKTLNEDTFEIDVMLKAGCYIDYPVVRSDSTLPADGFYHLNIQTTAKMFVGFMHISNNNAVWWGQGVGDVIHVGQAGHVTHVMKLIESPWYKPFHNWVGGISSSAVFPIDTTLAEILAA